MDMDYVTQRSGGRLVRLAVAGVLAATLSLGIGLVRGSAAVAPAPSRSVTVQDHSAGAQHRNGSGHHTTTDHRGGDHHHKRHHDDRDCWWDDWGWDGWWGHDRDCCDEDGADHWC
jgi:hypothetical protein